jgi:inward rectifier potassium channel
MKKEVVRAARGGYEIHIVGAPRLPLADLYHALLRVPWWMALLVIVGGYLFLNALFALGFMAVGGVANVHPGSFDEAFFFSVQTMGTIGYGTMAPVSEGAHVLVVAESVTGLIVTALATGLVFVRVSRTRARVMFCARAAIGPMDGVPTLMIRVGNERRTPIVDATFRMTWTRTIRTLEGVTIYRSVELPLIKDKATALARSWTVLHELKPGGPLTKETPDSFLASDAEVTLSLSGIDDTSGQPVNAHHTWYAKEVVWGARLADILSEDGPKMTLDLTKFHDLTATQPTEGFPYTMT